MTVHERCIDLMEKNEHLNAEYDKLLGVLAGVSSGEIATERLLVNLTDRSFVVHKEGESFGLPATINGLPNCVAGVPMAPVNRVAELLSKNGDQ